MNRLSIIMSDSAAPQKKERFAPKEPVNLAPPKDDVITRDYLAKCNGGRSWKWPAVGPKN